MASLKALSTYQETRPRTLQQCVDELKREARIRRQCYDRWVAEGKVSYTDAIDRLMRLESAAHYLALEAAAQEQNQTEENNNAPVNITPLTAAV